VGVSSTELLLPPCDNRALPPLGGSYAWSICFGSGVGLRLLVSGSSGDSSENEGP
jgi:hypothetical protein